jgi:hypothetical protein
MLWPFYFSYSTRFIARETREQGNTVRGKGKGEREKVSNTSDLLHSWLFGLFWSKGYIFIGER